jgi:sirohydrochlorin cobaltochelatase
MSNSQSRPFADAALVLLGHGATLNADSAAPVYQHASVLRERRLFAEVREAFWKQDPQLSTVLTEIAAPRVFVQPLFISEGYFSDEVIPQALGLSAKPPRQVSRVLQGRAQTLIYSRPVGSHPAMTDVLLARAREVMDRFPFPRGPKLPETTLFIAGHGTTKNENSREPCERQAELIRALNLFAHVHAVFLEEEPGISACYDLAQTRNLVIVPFFISEGLHTREDIPRLLGEPERLIKQRLAASQPTWRNPTEKKGKLVWYSPSVGTHPHLVEVILERLREAAGFS